MTAVNLYCTHIQNNSYCTHIQIIKPFGNLGTSLSILWCNGDNSLHQKFRKKYYLIKNCEFISWPKEIVFVPCKTILLGWYCVLQSMTNSLAGPISFPSIKLQKKLVYMALLTIKNPYLTVNIYYYSL